MYDLLIKNGLVADGSGAPLFRADVAVQDGKIVRVAPSLEGEAAETVDAAGLVISSGFIDAHSHADLSILAHQKKARLLEQGITLEVSGNCGLSAAPYIPQMVDDYMTMMPADTYDKLVEKGGSFPAFIEEITSHSLPLNAAFLVGHGALRAAVMGFEDRPATQDEIARMQALLCEAMEAGAFGFSSGLIYPPGSYALPEELTALAKTAAAYPGAVYATHMRNESSRVAEAVDESIALGAETGLHVHISHHKVAGLQNAGLSAKTLGSINAARAKGQNVTLDAYPYDGGVALLIETLPPKYRTEGNAALIARLRTPEFRAQLREELSVTNGDFENLIGLSGADRTLVLNYGSGGAECKSLAELAAAHGKDVYDELFDQIIASGGSTIGIYRMACTGDLENILRHPAVMLGTDSMPVDDATAMSHPRERAAFPYFLSHFCRDNPWLTLEEGVRKCTGLPADTFGLTGKGYVREGMDADLVLFDYEKLRANAVYGQGDLPNDGIEAVYVNGVCAVRGGKATGKRGGRVLLRRG